MMHKFTTLKARGVPLPHANVDTDQIIPARYLKATDKDGMGERLFADWRYSSDGTPEEGFVLNEARFQGAQILIADENFGCGSSREHAPLAIKAAGVSCVIAATFARIFFRNAINIGLPLLECPEAVENTLSGDELEIDLEKGEITNVTRMPPIRRSLTRNLWRN